MDKKIKIKKYYELSVESLQKKLNFSNSQKKYHGTKNSKIMCETNMYIDKSQVNNI